MNLCEYDQWSQGEEAAIGFLRHAEIKHGRIAMFAFVGYVVQSNGIHWPWNIESSGLSFGDISAAGSPPEQWDALSSAAKAQVRSGPPSPPRPSLATPNPNQSPSPSPNPSPRPPPVLPRDRLP